ncbi:MAG: hypothetical protein HZB39_15610 [Planctomycetes bacterium]|nr:hypothetical protein [Planctomycetota bacterium]
MRRRRAERAFPIPLWASLLVGLLALVQPAATARVEAVGAQLVGLPLRAVAAFAPRVAEGASREVSRDAARHATASLLARRDAALRRRPAGLDAALSARTARVVERRGQGAHGADELVLDVRRDALAGVEPFVIVGDVLVGFLADDPVTDDDALRGLARVALLHHKERGRLPRRVPCTISSATLALLVEPAADVDRWPLRCVLLDDPYRAAALGGDGALVRTSGLLDDPLGPLPQGLLLGSLRVFGYRDAQDRVLPIALHVEPALQARAIDAVALWSRSSGPAARRAVVIESIEVSLLRLPVPSAGRERYLATAARLVAPLQKGAAVVDGSRLLGVCEDGGLGQAVVAPFGQPGRSWALAFVPDSGGAPIDFVATSLGRSGARVRLVPIGVALPEGPGDLCALSASRDLPGGLWIGRAAIDVAGELVVEHESLADVARAGVLRHVGVAEGPR